jgi:hypothetical protein
LPFGSSRRSALFLGGRVPPFAFHLVAGLARRALRSRGARPHQARIASVHSAQRTRESKKHRTAQGRDARSIRLRHETLPQTVEGRDRSGKT